ncbi:MAG: transposase zinc-binding domain-containing protein, partial [Verrucomicrobia bacterium]|nr:transposase zinc-binding domain-containing protein [Verrucomicrobiota bacterium]
MPFDHSVLGVLRRFLPEFLATKPALSADQHRALWAISHCRTAAMGGRALACTDCRQIHFAWHSCNHKACPQCGRAATAQWVQRELQKLVEAPYFLVTFTLPAQLRTCFFGPFAKEAYDLFFAAVSGALSEKLATAKGLRATTSGFTA